MYDLEKWCADFQTLVPVDEKNISSNEATFHCLQGVAYIIDKMVNVGVKDLLGVGAEKLTEQTNETCWCDLDELCRRHPELRKSNVVSRQWRIQNDFPSKGGYKCRQMYYEPDVIKWINERLRGKNVSPFVSPSKKKHSQIAL